MDELFKQERPNKSYKTFNLFRFIDDINVTNDKGEFGNNFKDTFNMKTYILINKIQTTLRLHFWI